MRVTIKDIILLVIIAVMAFFIFDGCQAKKRVLQQSESLASYTDSISFYKSKSDELIASNETLVITSASQVSGLKEELENLRLKKPRTVIKYKNRVEIKEVEGKMVTLNVSAWEGEIKVGEGSHERYVIEVAKFLERVKQT